MNLSRCEKGHFFDKEKFSTCPHCAQGVRTDENLTTVFTEDLDSGIKPTEALDPTNTGVGISPIPSMAAPTPNMIPVPDTTETVQQSGNGMMGMDFNTSVTMNDDDKTVAFFGDVFASQESGKVIPASKLASPRVSTPCVGWLVATVGSHIGQDFRLKAGKNFIGRDTKMDIVLDGDKSVSRNRHAIVVYEPKRHLYMVQPGESSELVYLNDQVVLGPMKLSAYDIITVGEINLLFMPLCGEKFNWTDILHKGN